MTVDLTPSPTSGTVALNGIEDRLGVDPEAAARTRLIAALEEVHAAAKALGLDPGAIGELYAPLALRADAWCHRIDREAIAWRRIVRAPLFSMARAPGVAA